MGLHEREDTTPELVTILPVAVMGPVMSKEISGANHIVQASLNGQMPGYPNIYVPTVDVGDVSTAHLAAMPAQVAVSLVSRASPTTR